jgi:hypothetical protein
MECAEHNIECTFRPLKAMQVNREKQKIEYCFLVELIVEEIFFWDV